MQDAVPSVIRLRAQALLDDADTAALRLSGTPSVATGRATVAFSVVVAGALTLMLSDAAPPLVLSGLIAVLIAVIVLVAITRRTRSVLPHGWNRRLAFSSFLPPAAVYLINGALLVLGHRPQLPLWGALGIAGLLAAPLAASGVWLIRRRGQQSPSPTSASDNPFIVLAALAAVDAAGLRSLRLATGFPDDALDRIMRDLDARELVDLGWGGSRPGLNTPVALTPAGAAEFEDVRARLRLEADGIPDR